jgi:hypothetical protein
MSIYVSLFDMRASSIGAALESLAGKKSLLQRPITVGTSATVGA